MKGSGLVFGLCGALALPACTPRDAMPQVSAENGALVQLELTYSREILAGNRDLLAGAGAEAGPARVEAEAHFVRYRAADRAVDRAAVASLLGLGGDESIPLDGCRVQNGAPATATGALEVALLDAGSLTVRAGGYTEAVLEPHHYPELLPFVTGVVYGIEAAASREVTPATRVEIEANGGEDVGPFVAATTLPRDFPNLVVGKDAAGDLDLRWAQLATPAGGGASLSVDLRWAGPKPGALRCRVADDGRFAIARALTDGMDAAVAAGATAQVSVARAERSSLDAPGAGRGEMIVTLRDVASLSPAQQP